MGIYDGNVDLATTLDGDLVVKNGQLSFNRGLDWFIQEVNKILKSSREDWIFAPYIGADLINYYGKPNTREVGKEIEDVIYNEIIKQQLNFPLPLQVKVIPMNRNELKIYININDNGSLINVSKNILNLTNGILVEDLEEIENKPVMEKVKRNPNIFKIR